MHQLYNQRHHGRLLTRLVALILTAFVATGMTVVTASPASADCPLFRGMDADEAKTPECGTAVRPYGVRVGLPARSSGAGYYGKPYGTIKGLTGVIAEAVSNAAVKSMADYYDVPWPRKPKDMTTDKQTKKYRVYQVWFVGSKKFKKKPGPGKKDAWKYGISAHDQKQRRPKDGVRYCERDSRTRANSCQWKWVRQNIVGFYRARKIEAMYAGAYKKKRGRCPIGMTACR